MGIVIVNRNEPDHEVAQRLLELAEEKGHDARSVEAQRGEHDAGLSFRVPDDVAEAFESDRDQRWPARAAEGDGDRPVAALNEDAVAADGTRSATDAAVTANDNASQARTARPGKAQTTQKRQE
jgi:hypothetical protein